MPDISIKVVIALGVCTRDINRLEATQDNVLWTKTCYIPTGRSLRCPHIIKKSVSEYSSTVTHLYYFWGIISSMDSKNATNWSANGPKLTAHHQTRVMFVRELADWMTEQKAVVLFSHECSCDGKEIYYGTISRKSFAGTHQVCFHR